MAGEADAAPGACVWGLIFFIGLKTCDENVSSRLPGPSSSQIFDSADETFVRLGGYVRIAARVFNQKKAGSACNAGRRRLHTAGI